MNSWALKEKPCYLKWWDHPNQTLLSGYQRMKSLLNRTVPPFLTIFGE